MSSELRGPLCGTCGGTEFAEISENERQCLECGQRQGFSRMTLVRDSDPDPAALEQYRQGRARSLRRALEAFASASFAPLGLDEQWMGKRWIGGQGTSNGVVTRLELAHGDDPFDLAMPQVRVETRTDPVAMHVSPGEMLRKLWHHEGVIDPALREAWFQRRDVNAFDRACAHVDIMVNDTPARFQLVSAGDTWLANALIGDQLIAIEARYWPIARTSVVTVHDLTPYERRDW